MFVSNENRLPLLRPILLLALNSLLIFMVCIKVLNIRTLEEKFNQEQFVTSFIGQFATRLQIEINSDLDLLNGFLAALTINSDLSDEDFNLYALNIVGKRPRINNIALAQDYVITNVFPLKGNEAVLGLDYKTIPEQLEAVERVRTAGQIVIAGPLDLIQGGKGIIGRVPIFKNADSEKIFLGFISTVIDYEQLMLDVDLPSITQDYNIAIRGRDGFGAEGEIFMGDFGNFTNGDSVLLDISLPNGSWQIAVVPKSGWITFPSEGSYIIFFFALIWLIFAILIIVSEIRKREKEKLIVALKKAQAANKAKTTFLANLSHDLRTPLNAINGFSEMIVNKLYGPEFNHNYVKAANMIHQSGRTLLNTINNLLNIAGDENADKKLDEQEFDIKAALNLACTQASFLSEGKKQKLSLTIGEDIGDFKGDLDQVSRIFTNLINNAIKFSPESSLIEVILKLSDKGDLEFMVVDQGPGIPKDKLTDVMKPFEQLNDRPDIANNGSGLGLAIVDMFVKQHDGHFVLLPTEKGLIAKVSLPKERIVERVEQKMRSRQ